MPNYTPAYTDWARRIGITDLADPEWQRVFGEMPGGTSAVDTPPPVGGPGGTPGGGTGAGPGGPGGGSEGGIDPNILAQQVRDAFAARAQEVRNALFHTDDLSPDRPEDRAQMLHRFEAGLATADPTALAVAADPELRNATFGWAPGRREQHRIEQGLGSSIAGAFEAAPWTGAGPGMSGGRSPAGISIPRAPGQPFSGGINLGSWNIGADFHGTPHRGAVTQAVHNALTSLGLSDRAATGVRMVGGQLVGLTGLPGMVINTIVGLIDTVTANPANWAEAARQTQEELANLAMEWLDATRPFSLDFINALNDSVEGAGAFAGDAPPGTVSAWGFLGPDSSGNPMRGFANRTNFGTRGGDEPGPPGDDDSTSPEGSPDFLRGGIITPGPPAGPKRAIMAHEGEYVMPPTQTKKHLRLLDAIRADRPDLITLEMARMVRQAMAGGKKPKARAA